jgi:hypothetical protein
MKPANLAAHIISQRGKCRIRPSNPSQPSINALGASFDLKPSRRSVYLEVAKTRWNSISVQKDEGNWNCGDEHGLRNHGGTI